MSAGKRITPFCACEDAGSVLQQVALAELPRRSRIQFPTAASAASPRFRGWTGNRIHVGDHQHVVPIDLEHAAGVSQVER